VATMVAFFALEATKEAVVGLLVMLILATVALLLLTEKKKSLWI